jgi:lipid-A-disaccharide synthase
VIVYRFSRLTYWLARLVIGQRSMGLPNVILGEAVFPELVQHHLQAEALVRQVRRLQAERAELEPALEQLRSRMGRPGASERAAQELLQLLPPAHPLPPASPRCP